jgi:hypothetical protein
VRDATIIAEASQTKEPRSIPIPNLPPMVQETLFLPVMHWTCPNCFIELRITSKQCRTCKTWQGGKRGGKQPRKAVVDKSNETPKNQEKSGLGRPFKKHTKNATEDVAVNVIRTGAIGADVSPFGDSAAANLDDLSISMTNSNHERFIVARLE